MTQAEHPQTPRKVEYRITTDRLTEMIRLAGTPDPRGRGRLCEVCHGEQAHFPHCSEWTPHARGLQLVIEEANR